MSSSNNFEKIIDLISSYETIIIHRHEKPDLDAYGSQFALKLAILKKFNQKKVYCAGDEGHNLKKIAKIDKIKDNDFENALCIILDTANKDRIADKRYKLAKKTIKIDHHLKIKDEDYADIEYINENKSSSAEIIWDLIKKAKWEVDKEIATLCYLGIVGDTGRFLYPNTTKETFKSVMEMMSYDIDLIKINKDFFSIEEKILRLKGHVLSNSIFKNKVNYFIITKELLEKLNLKIGDATKALNDLSMFKGVEIWMLISEDENNYRVNIRSKEIAINELAVKFGGGGHKLACGVILKNLKQVNNLIKEAMRLVNED